MVGVVSPPDTHSECWIESEVFPGPPKCLEADDRFVVAPPLGRPIAVAPVDAAPIHGSSQKGEADWVWFRVDVVWVGEVQWCRAVVVTSSCCVLASPQGGVTPLAKMSEDDQEYRLPKYARLREYNGLVQSTNDGSALHRRAQILTAFIENYWLFAIGAVDGGDPLAGRM